MGRLCGVVGRLWVGVVRLFDIVGRWMLWVGCEVLCGCCGVLRLHFAVRLLCVNCIVECDMWC